MPVSGLRALLTAASVFKRTTDALMLKEHHSSQPADCLDHQGLQVTQASFSWVKPSCEQKDDHAEHHPDEESPLNDTHQPDEPLRPVPEKEVDSHVPDRTHGRGWREGSAK